VPGPLWVSRDPIPSEEMLAVDCLNILPLKGDLDRNTLDLDETLESSVVLLK